MAEKKIIGGYSIEDLHTSLADAQGHHLDTVSVPVELLIDWLSVNDPEREDEE